MRSALPVLLVIAFTFPSAAQQKIENTINRDFCASKPPDIVALTAKANAGDPEAQYQMGRLNFGDGGDKRQAAVWFSKAAEQGNDDAQFWLGTMYERGGVVEQDMAAALKWYQLSAKQGNPDAQVSLGQMYEDGNGVQQDYLEAEKWYRKAAEHFPDRGGAGVARNQLANLYRDGRLVPNYVDAYMWFAIIGSVEDMKHAAKQMTSSQLAEAERRTREWVKTHPNSDSCAPISLATAAQPMY